jgi:hypothetical protein
MRVHIPGSRTASPAIYQPTPAISSPSGLIAASAAAANSHGPRNAGSRISIASDGQPRKATPQQRSRSQWKSARHLMVIQLASEFM